MSNDNQDNNNPSDSNNDESGFFGNTYDSVKGHFSDNKELYIVGTVSAGITKGIAKGGKYAINKISAIRAARNATDVALDVVVDVATDEVGDGLSEASAGFMRGFFGGGSGSSIG